MTEYSQVRISSWPFFSRSDASQVQERLEVSRHQQLCERQGGSRASRSQRWSCRSKVVKAILLGRSTELPPRAPNLPSVFSLDLSEAHETTVGRLMMSAGPAFAACSILTVRESWDHRASPLVSMPGAASWQGNKDLVAASINTNRESLWQYTELGRKCKKIASAQTLLTFLVEKGNASCIWWRNKCLSSSLTKFQRRPSNWRWTSSTRRPTNSWLRPESQKRLALVVIVILFSIGLGSGVIVFDGHSGSLCAGDSGKDADPLNPWGRVVLGPRSTSWWTGFQGTPAAWPGVMLRSALLLRNLQKCLSAKPALTEEHLKNAVRRRRSQTVTDSTDAKEKVRQIQRSAKVTEACVLTDDEFLTKAASAPLSTWIFTKGRTLVKRHGRQLAHAVRFINIQAREKEALDGTTMILCLLWPEDGRSQGKSRCRHSGKLEGWLWWRKHCCKIYILLSNAFFILILIHTLFFNCTSFTLLI